MRTDRYRTGWNDLAHGVNLPTGELGVDPLEWAQRMAEVARQAMAECRACHIGDISYYRGVIDCAREYQEKGTISRLEG